MFSLILIHTIIFSLNDAEGFHISANFSFHKIRNTFDGTQSFNRLVFLLYWQWNFFSLSETHHAMGNVEKTSQIMTFSNVSLLCRSQWEMPSYDIIFPVPFLFLSFHGWHGLSFMTTVRCIFKRYKKTRCRM